MCGARLPLPYSQQQTQGDKLRDADDMGQSHSMSFGMRHLKIIDISFG
jgi:hypothetical protein